MPAIQDITVTIDVTSTGQRAGEEVVQPYLAARKLTPHVNLPPKQLKGFQQIRLSPGNTQQVKLNLTRDQLHISDSSRARYRVPAGDYTISIGGASDALVLRSQITIDAAPERPGLMITNIRALPAFPKAGVQVVLLASVLNHGTGPTPVDKPLRACFFVNGQLVGWSPDLREPIPAGGMALVCGPEFPSGSGPWAPDGKDFSVRAEADPRNSILETCESNNSSVKVISLRR